MFDGMMPPNHRKAICDEIIRQLSANKNIFILEIGIAIGQGTKLYAETLKKYSNNKSKLFSVDPLDDKKAEMYFRYGEDENWVSEYTNGKYNTMMQAITDILNEFDNIELCQTKSNEFFERTDLPKFNVIIIDGDHSYQQTTDDLNNSIVHLSKNGAIFVHDYKHNQDPDVEKAVDNFMTVNNKISLNDLGGMALLKRTQ